MDGWNREHLSLAEVQLPLFHIDFILVKFVVESFTVLYELSLLLTPDTSSTRALKRKFGLLSFLTPVSSQPGALVIIY